MTKISARLIFALKVFSIHFLASAALAIFAGWIIFKYWIPVPYEGLVKAPQLFLILLGVNVVCGPLLSAILANPAKCLRELFLDFLLVALLQLAALGYGLYVIAEVRPVALVFEVDRFVVVSASQINSADLEKAPKELQQLPWNGPQLKGVRGSQSGDETLRSIELSLQGIEPSVRPDWWQNYELSRSQVRQRMHPIKVLQQQANLEQRRILNATMQALSLPSEQIFYLPLVSSKQLDNWVVLLDPQASIVGYLPMGGFAIETQKID